MSQPTYSRSWFGREARETLRKVMPELTYDEAIELLERIFRNQNGICPLTGTFLMGQSRMNAKKTMVVDRINQADTWYEENMQWVSRATSDASPSTTVTFSSFSVHVDWCIDSLRRLGYTVTPPEAK